jgi:hypothetical protein
MAFVVQADQTQVLVRESQHLVGRPGRDVDKDALVSLAQADTVAIPARPDNDLPDTQLQRVSQGLRFHVAAVQHHPRRADPRRNTKMNSSPERTSTAWRCRCIHSAAVGSLNTLAG